MPLNGSSNISTGGSPSSAAAMPSRCRMPREYPPGLPPRGGLQAGLLDHRIDPPGVEALGVGQPQQVVARAAARLQRARVQQRPDVGQRVLQRAVRLAADQRRCPRRARPGRGSTRIVVDLPAPFGPTKPVTWPGWTVNVIPSSA